MTAASVTLGGNTVGDSAFVAKNLVLHGGSNVTLSGDGPTGRVVFLAGGGGGGTTNVYNSTVISGGTTSNVTQYAGPVIAGGTTSQATGTVVFGGATGGNVTFGLDTAGNMTANAPGGTAPAGLGLATAATGSIGMTGNSSGLSLSIPAFLTTAQPPGAYLTTAAQSDHSHGALALTNLSGTSASSGLSLSAANPGGGLTDFQWPFSPPPLATSSCYTGGLASTGGSTKWTVSGYIGPIVLERPLHFSDFEYYVSLTNAVGTGSVSLGHQFGIYSLNGGSAHSLISTFCWQAMISHNSVTAISWHQYRGTASSTFSSSAAGNLSTAYIQARQIVCHTTSQSLSQGTYYLAHVYTQRSSGANVAYAGSAYYSNGYTGAPRPGTNAQRPPMYESGVGIFSTTTEQSAFMLPIMPASIHTSALTNTGGSSQWRYPAPIMYL